MKYSEEIKQKEFSVAVPDSIHKEIINAITDKGYIRFMIAGAYKPSDGLERFTCLIYRLFLPEQSQNIIDFLKSAYELLSQEGAGLVVIGGKEGLDELLRSEEYASFLMASQLPSLFLAIDKEVSPEARILIDRDIFKEASTIRIIGKKLSVYYDEASRIIPEFKEIYKRTVTVWGKKNHDHLARLRVGIIGLGSVGSLVAEALARMGVERFVLVDFDEIQLHNLDRLLGASVDDIGLPKVTVAHRQILLAATATNVEVTPVISGITEGAGYRRALDCDILFSCVDRPWPRYILNNLAYNHLIPVVDGGIQVRLNPETLEFEGADWQVQSVGPDRPCLECLEAYKPADVSIEQQGLLEDPTYLAGLPEDHEFKRNENIFPFSMNLASLEVLQFIEQVTGIGHTHYYGTQRFSYNEGYIRLNDERCCQPGCLFKAGVALGDTIFPPPVGLDFTAEQARLRQNKND